MRSNDAISSFYNKVNVNSKVRASALDHDTKLVVGRKIRQQKLAITLLLIKFGNNQTFCCIAKCLSEVQHQKKIGQKRLLLDQPMQALSGRIENGNAHTVRITGVNQVGYCIVMHCAIATSDMTTLNTREEVKPCLFFMGGALRPKTKLVVVVGGDQRTYFNINFPC